MASRYQIINSKLVPLAEGQKPEDDAPIVEALSEDEFLELGDTIDDKTRKRIKSLLEAESCYVDVCPDCIIGSMAVPDKEDLMGDRCLFSYYWRPDRLVFIDEGTLASCTLRHVANSDIDNNMTTAYCLQAFFRELLLGDTTWLGELEDKMEDAEESMLVGQDHMEPGELNMYRRITVRVSTYYQQVAAMALVLSGNDNGLMTCEEANSFEYIMNRADRLESRAETIREYSLTLRELHQTQIDIKQNNIMQLLTIVTVLIAPLSLIAGWFGMNFTNIPGVNEWWGFPLICVVGIVITLALVFWFHKKKWL